MDIEEVEKAVIGAASQTEVLRRLHVPITTLNRDKLREFAREHSIEIPPARLKLPNDSILVYGRKHTRSVLLPRMLERGVEYVCAKCGLEPLWLGFSLTLQIDHIDGDNRNNVLDNLRFLCPNCHSQCATSFNNKKRSVRNYQNKCKLCNSSINSKYVYCESCVIKRKSMSPAYTSHTCVDCDVPIPSKGALRCVACSRINSRTIDYPPLEDVIGCLKRNNSFLGASRELGIGDNTLRKFLKRNGVDPKTVL